MSVGEASSGGVVEMSGGGVGPGGAIWGLLFAKPPVGAGGGAIGVLVKPVVDAGAPTVERFLTMVPEGALARPPAGAFGGAPKMGGFPTGAFHEYPVCLVGHDEWLDHDKQGEVRVQ